MTSHDASLDVAAHQEGLPDPRPRDQRAAARLPRLGHTSQKPQSVLDAMTRFYETSYANDQPQRLPPRRRGHRRATRAPAARSPRFINAPSRRRDRVHQERHRGAQPRRLRRGAAPTSRAGDVVVLTQMEHHANIVPWHMLAAERGIELRWIAAHRRRPARPHRPRPAARRRQGRSAFTAMSQRARHAHPGAPARRRRPRRRRARHRRRLPVRAPPRHRRAGLGADFVAFTGHKMCGPIGHRRAVGPRGAARRHAAVPRRRRHDPRRPPRRVHARPSCREVRGRHAADRRGDRARRGRRLPRAARHGRRPPARDGAHRLRPRHAHRALRRRHHDPRARRTSRSAAACSRFAFRDLHPHDSRQVLDQTQRVRARRPPLRQAADARARRRRHRPGLLLRLQRRRRRRRPGRRASTPPPTSSPSEPEDDTMPGLEDLYREIILDHYRNPRNRGELPTPPAHRAEGFNPLCGDEIVVYLDVDDGVVDRHHASAARAARSASRSASMMSAGGQGQDASTRSAALIRAFKAMMSIHEHVARRRRRRGRRASST